MPSVLDPTEGAMDYNAFWGLSEPDDRWGLTVLPSSCEDRPHGHGPTPYTGTFPCRAAEGTRMLTSDVAYSIQVAPGALGTLPA